MLSVTQAERAHNAAVVDLWHCQSFKVMLPKAAQDGALPERGYLASAASAMIKSGNLLLVHDGDELVGTINRFGRDPASPEIGWFVKEGRRGEGIAGRAVAIALDHLFAQGAETVGFGMFASNAASLRVAEKLGLSPGPSAPGTPAGHLRFSIPRHAWENRAEASAAPGPR